MNDQDQSARSNLWDDPVFIEWMDLFIDQHGTPPGTWDIVEFIDARASGGAG